MFEGQELQGAPAARDSANMSLAGTRLGRSPYLSSEERRALEGAFLPIQSTNARVDLIREGHSTDLFQVLIEGWACRFKTTRHGIRQIVALLLPGDAANLDAFVFRQLDYGILTLTTAKVATIPRDRLLALADQHAGVAKTLTWLAMGENAILSQWAICLGRLSAKQRVAHLLCEVNARLGNVDDATESHFELPMTQEHIADALGLTPVHVNRTIKQLRVDRLIEVEGRAITIADVDGLHRVAGFDSAYLHDPPAA